MTGLQEAMVTARRNGEDAVAWAAASANSIRDRLRVYGRFLMRDFSAEPGAAQDVLSTLTGDLMEDVFWSTPRRRIANKTFTATHYPAQREIRMHSEMAYSPVFPRLLCFHAVKAADQGGATPITDVDAVSRSLADIVELFDKRGVLYLRNFRPGIDIPFAEAFGKATHEEAIVAAQARGMDVEMCSDGCVRIMARGRGALSDTSGKALLWFNQMHLFHPASLPDEDRRNMLQVFGEGGMPRDATFGDGALIPDHVVHRVNETLEAHAEDMNWQDGDILLLDNLRYMHGRRSFVGERIVHVAMGAPESGDMRAPLS